MRRLPILSITPSSTVGVPSSFTVDLDFTQLFHGKEWIDGAGTRSPYYTYDTDSITATPAPPVGTGLLVATTFEVVENVGGKYNGRYTVFTKATAGSLSASEVIGGDTVIRVNETLVPGTGTELTTGYITNISTYLLTIAGESSQLLLEQQNIQTRPVELMGNQSSGWGEVLFQNLLKQAQCFAGSTAPANPFLGQLWYDTTTGQLKIRTAAATWIAANSNIFAPYRHTQSTTSTTWTITHNLGLTAPYICTFDVFVDTGGGVYKPILPNDVTFTNANSMTVTFSTTHTGYALVRI